MLPMLPIAVLYDDTDCARFMAERPSVRAVLALTPLSQFFLRGVELPVLDGGRNYGDCSQTRTVVLRERLLRAWREAVPPKDMPNSAVWSVLDMALVTLLHGYDRLRRVLGDSGPWLIRRDRGWVTVECRDEACRALSHHILSRYRYFMGTIIYRPPPFAGAYRLLCGLLVALGRRRRPLWVVSRSDHPLGLEQALMTVHPRGCQWLCATADAGWREYLRLARDLWRALTGSSKLQLRVLPRRQEFHESQATRAIEALPDREMRALLREFLPRILPLCGIAGGARQEFTDILRGLEPDFMLASEIPDCVTAALFEACGDLSVPRRIACHNSFGVARGAASLIVLRYQISHQFARGEAEQMIFWNHDALAAVRQAMPQAANRTIAVAAKTLPVLAASPAQKPFHVLHASNCLRYFSQASWIYENVNEFVEGAAALVKAGLTVNGTTYMIRTKQRPYEMNENVLRANFGESERVEIAFRSTRPFKDDLARADLLVAFRSTTIMEALYARKPVLLWGITTRYRELKGRSTPPRPGDRAAVYTVDRAEDLADMLAGIRDAHRHLPLTDEELEPHVLPTQTMTREAWARTCSMSPSV